MKNNDLKKIIISFERPKKSTTKGYDFLKNPTNIKGGGLYDEIAIIKEELSLNDVIEDFIQVSETLSDIIGEEYSYLIASVFSLSWNLFSIKSFPDEYKEILDLIKEGDSGLSLNSDKINELIDDNKDIIKILDELIKQKFLRKKKSGEFVVRKKILSSIHVSFL